VLQIVNESQMRQIIENEKIVMVTLFSTTCSACRLQDKILQKLLPVYEQQMRFLKMDIQVNPKFAAQYKIFGVPVSMFFLNGKLVKFKSKAGPGKIDRLTGFRDKKTIEGIITYLLSLKIN